MDPLYDPKTGRLSLHRRASCLRKPGGRAGAQWDSHSSCARLRQRNTAADIRSRSAERGVHGEVYAILCWLSVNDGCVPWLPVETMKPVTVRCSRPPHCSLLRSSYDLTPRARPAWGEEEVGGGHQEGPNARPQCECVVRSPTIYLTIYSYSYSYRSRAL